MAYKGGIDVLDRIIQDIRSSELLTDGMTVLLVKKTLPVFPQQTRANKLSACN